MSPRVSTSLPSEQTMERHGLLTPRPLVIGTPQHFLLHHALPQNSSSTASRGPQVPPLALPYLEPEEKLSENTLAAHWWLPK